jgi:ribonucleoside-triphosphate reductase (formate)
MKCPYCNSDDIKVLDTRETGNYETTRRRRECIKCAKRFTTYERVELLDITINKSDGTKQAFDKEKVRQGVLKACEKRPVSEDQINTLVNDIETSVRLMESTEIKSLKIGEMIMNKLKELDKVAYIRFASVFKGFKNYSAFEREVKKLKQEPIELTNRKILQIRKRDGSIALFDQQQITESIFSAAKSLGGDDRKLAERLGTEVVEFLESKFESPTIITVEEIMDAAEKVLMDSGHSSTAKAFILQRQHKTKLQKVSSTLLDVNNTMKEYLDQASWRVKENASFQYSFSGLLLHTAGKIIANYALNEIYSREIGEAHEKGYIHVHDLNNAIIGYCAGWSLKNLLLWGFGGIPNKADSKPAKHMDVAVAHMVNYIGCLQMEFAGAQAFSSVDTLLAPFIRTDNMNYKEIKQSMQRLIFHLNIPNRWAGQFPFSNLTFDWVVPDDLKNDKAIVGGKEMDFTYGDCQKEMDMVNKAFIEVMLEGDASGRNFAFPIPTYNLTKDFNWDSSNSELLFKMTAKYGAPYFQNYIGSGMDPSSIRAMCCRLNLNMLELTRRPGHTFAMGDNTGSLGVVTLNLNRIGYETKGNKEAFFAKLAHYMDLSKESLEIKRKLVNQNLENNLMPYTKRYLGHFNNHFSTVGLIGGHEMCMNFLGEGLETKAGKAFMIEVLEFMRTQLIKYQRETGNLYNLEATPAEGASYRLAKWDKRMYGDDIFTSGEGEPYLTNSSHLPVDFTDDAIAALEHQNDIQTLYTGGTIFHTFLGESMSSWESCRALVKKIAYNTKIPYFSITPTFSVCPEHGYVNGEHSTCPHMKEEANILARE